VWTRNVVAPTFALGAGNPTKHHQKKHFKYFEARSNERVEFHPNGAAVRMTATVTVEFY
jgi:hypothetical protein